MWLTGHSFIKAKVRETRSPFGGELSGHFFFEDNFYGHDDGAYATLRLLAFLQRKNWTLKEATAQLPQYISSPEIKFGAADDIKFEFIRTKIQADLRRLYPQAQFTDIDGIRADLPDRMVIIRASQNGPYITVKFESKHQSGYDELRQQIKEILHSHPEVDFSYGVNLDALD